jgi:hypothetical protein
VRDIIEEDLVWVHVAPVVVKINLEIFSLAKHKFIEATGNSTVLM